MLVRFEYLLLLVIAFVSFSLQKSPCKIIRGGVDYATKNLIVNLHNQIRLRVAQGKVPGQPKATDMRAMFWDERLAEEAQKIANTCEFKHVNVNDGRWIFVGQNLYTSISSVHTINESGWRAAVQAWFNEHKDYKYPHSTLFPVTGHYTQLVWANTNNVGCGYTYFHNKEKKLYQSLYVCNYGPGGNVIGQAPYKTSR